MSIIIKTIIASIILVLVSTNMIGMIMRSLYQPRLEDDMDDLTLNELMSRNNPNPLATVIFLVTAAGYLFALYYFWNVWLALAGLILMLTRIPDLLFEIRTGQKLSLFNMPKGPLYIFCTILMWGVLPLIWYSFYTVK